MIALFIVFLVVLFIFGGAFAIWEENPNITLAEATEVFLRMILDGGKKK